ncbi:amidohydrolase [Marinomonas ushuaiensis DSM 15871]|uniref:Amidohydrolase n=1 Tax=Marinomonas ushuaiensis DSM 15871 TaxID=1122207 RepID=X7E7E1_9GAMM|nr:M20 family metallopeptidase [Marinomonas ushuaiensis]ETX11078.1 amidohydrolase [Marinomonas ushuaiensis DSM 15871]
MFSVVHDSEYILLRKDIHKFPELQFEEFRTASIVTEILTKLGYAVTTGVGGTGVVGLLDTGLPGDTIAFRADMDALPIKEENTFDHKSTNHGLMHACGHDGHTASLLCAAEALMKNKDRYKGKIKLIFQPAEEGGAGAKAMIEDGVLESPYVDAIFGYHNRPGFKQGYVFAKAGPAMGGNTAVSIKITGKGGHAAMPHLANDPVVAASTFVTLLQSVVSRKLSPLSSGVITVASIHGGDASNVIADTTEVKLSIRYDGEPTKHALLDGVRLALDSACNQFGCTSDLNVDVEVMALINDEASTNKVIDACKKYEVSDAIEKIDYMPTMGAEDFSFYLAERPGCYFFIGNGEESAYLHNAHYDFNDKNIKIAAKVYLSIAEQYLSKENTL